MRKLPVTGRLLAFLLFAACAREKPHFNVVLITLDTTRADHLGCYGGSARTPAIDALASSGVRFDQADAAVPLTLPSHATLLSGVLPLHHGVRNNGGGSFPSARETLSTRFQSAGYATGAFVSSFVLDHRFGLNRGFDTYDDAVDRDAASLIDSERRGGATADAAIAWISAKRDRPFFAWVHFYDPHAPYAPPKPYEGYDGEIAYVDAQIARIMKTIDRRRTIVVIVGDHGEGLGDHGELHHGLLTYESTLRVPFIIAAPNLEPFVVKSAVSTADLAPTIASLAGTALAGTDGVDISEALQKRLDPKPREIYAETEYPVTFGWTGLRVIRNGEMKLMSGRNAELFRLPDENVDVTQTERRTFSLLSRRLDELKAGEVTNAATVDAETKAKLASLGYIAPAAPLPESQRADPRAMRDLFRKFEDATAAMSSGHPLEAKRLAEQLVTADPRNRVFRSTLANACRATGDISRALALYREAVALSPSDGDAWYDLASALEQTHTNKEALTAAEEAARLKPNDAEFQNLRGTILADSGDASAAFDAFQRALAIDPRNARAYTNSGNALRAMGRNDDAAIAFKHAVELDPRDPDPLNGIGVLLVQGGHSREALLYFDQALALAPELGEARLNRAVALATLGETAEARHELQKLSGTPQRAAAAELLRRLR